MKTLLMKHSVFLHKTFNGLADSLIKIFIPVIILMQTNDIKLAFLFMILRPLIFVVFNNLLKPFLQKHAVLSIVLHIIPIICVQFIIFFVPLTLWWIIMISFLMAMFNVFYSVPFNLLFLFSDQKLNVAKMEIGTNVGKIIFIIIGGFIIGVGTVGQLVLLCVVASLLYVLSVMPLLFGQRNICLFQLAKKETPDVLSKQDKWTYRILHISFGVFQVLMDDILPVYLFYNGLAIEYIALLQAAIEVARILANMLANKLYGMHKSVWSIIISLLFYVVAANLVLWLNNPVVIYTLVTIVGITFPLVFVPIFKEFCSQIQNKSYLEDEIAFRDSYIFGGRPVLAATYFLGFTFLSPVIFASLSAVALGISAGKLFQKQSLQKTNNKQ